MVRLPQHIKGADLIQVPMTSFVQSIKLVTKIVQVLLNISQYVLTACLVLVALLQIPASTTYQKLRFYLGISCNFLQHLQLAVSLRDQFFDFIYVKVIRHKDVSNSPVLLAYQLRHRDDVLAWYETFKLVPKMGQFWANASQYIFTAPQVAQSLLGTSQCITTMSERRQPYSGTSCVVSVTCQVSQSHLSTSWYVVTTSQIGPFY